MNPGNDNQVDWTAAATPNEGVVTSLSRPAKPPAAPKSRRNVMDTLLGENNLSAFDADVIHLRCRPR